MNAGIGLVLTVVDTPSLLADILLVAANLGNLLMFLAGLLGGPIR